MSYTSCRYQDLVRENLPKLYNELVNERSLLLCCKPLYDFNKNGEPIIVEWTAKGVDTAKRYRPGSDDLHNEMVDALRKECERVVSYFSCFIYEDWDDEIWTQVALKIGRDGVGVNFRIDYNTNKVVPLLDGPFTHPKYFNYPGGTYYNGSLIRGALGWTTYQYNKTKDELNPGRNGVPIQSRPFNVVTYKGGLLP